ncbi:MAG: insulinase family protein [Polyangiaceae bacterium]|nr:insulinase family protein [Polyangiaceae bacterium]
MTTREDGAPVLGAVLVESSHALPLVAVTVALRCGAATDPPDREGRARFTARLMRRTAGGRTAQSLDTYIDTLGAALGVDASYSSIAFQGVVVSRSFPRFVELLGDVLGAPDLTGQEFERLRRECIGELVEVLDNDRVLAQRWFRRRLFAEDAFGRSVAGTQRSINELEVSDVEAFHLGQVTAENVVLAFAGAVDDDQARSSAEHIFGRIPRGERIVETTADPRPPASRRLVIVDKPERTQTQILIGGLGTRTDDPDHTALQVGNTIFGGTFGARLAREIRVERGWSYGAYSNLTIDRRRHAFNLWTFPKAEDAARCIRHQLGMLERWCNAGITSDELEQAKRYLTRSHVFAVDTAAKRVSLALDEAIYDLPRGYYASYTERVNAVSLDEVNSAIRRRIDPKNVLVVVLGTASVIADSIRAAIDDLATSEIVPFDADP